MYARLSRHQNHRPDPIRSKTYVRSFRVKAELAGLVLELWEGSGNRQRRGESEARSGGFGLVADYFIV